MDLLLQTKSDEAVEKSTLQGKIVALYFSSSWCGACKRFTPLLSVLHDTAQEEDKDFEVVYVSSDDSPESCVSYMKEKHGDWLKVSWDQRNRLKMKHGVFSGKEQAEFPDTKRRSGIPTLVIIDKDGEEKELLDCDDEKVLKEIESKGAGFLGRWEKYRW